MAPSGAAAASPSEAAAPPIFRFGDFTYDGLECEPSYGEIEADDHLFLESEGRLADVVVVEAPVDAPWRFVPEVCMKGGELVVLVHAMDLSGGDHTLDEQGYNLRRNRLMSHVWHAIKDHRRSTMANFMRAFVNFHSMNNELRPIFEGSSLPANRWLCQYQTTCVVVGNGLVHVVGDSGGQVILSRGGKDIHLTSFEVLSPLGYYRIGSGREVKNITPLCYYDKEELKEGDSFLTICSRHSLSHVKGDFTPVLTTRVNAVGLVGAAEQIAGVHSDKTRTYVIVPLHQHLSQPQQWRQSEVERISPYDWESAYHYSVPYPWAKDKGTQEEEEEEEEDDDEAEEEEEEAAYHHDSIHVFPVGLRPLKDGELHQTPAPATSCERRGRFSPSIRLFSRRTGRITVIYGGYVVRIQIQTGELAPTSPTSAPTPTSLLNPLVKQLIEDIECEVRGVPRSSHVTLVPHTWLDACKIMIRTDGLAVWGFDRWKELTQERNRKTFGFLGH